MTRKTFFAKFRKYAGRFRWKIDGWNLRGRSGNNRIIDCCPITFLAYCEGKGKYESCDYKEAARDIGLSKKDADLIAKVADVRLEYLPGNQRPTRRALLNAVGVTESDNEKLTT